MNGMLDTMKELWPAQTIMAIENRRPRNACINTILYAIMVAMVTDSHAKFWPRRRDGSVADKID